MTTAGTPHCEPCTAFVHDIIQIARNDKNHFDQIWTAISKQMCSEGLGKAEQKLCFKVWSQSLLKLDTLIRCDSSLSMLRELGNAQEGAREFMAKQDPKDACQAIFFC